MRGDREKMHDMLEAIERIERYASQGREAFEQNELIQTWFTQNLQVIGEAARALSSEIREQHPEVPWSNIIGMRNILTHNYFEIDFDIVWVVVEQELTPLKQDIASIVQSLDDST
ncbi:HepT-like ribonuclease domain-containing protein [Nodosilinea sp. AN01ver1]|uniref:HepT-like ribonuclease domain-containing protein n=1 Tax=Nodosilinea sp. AN01ver1 TaxID=3423362 RepID=UPI003D30F687